MKDNIAVQRSRIICAISLFVLTGCSAMGIESKRVDYKSGADKAAALEVPPDLTAPAAGDRYVVPESVTGSMAVNSGLGRMDAAVPVQDVAAVNVLPGGKKVRLVRNGPQRWLAVEDRAENVWPLVRMFWQQSGFVLVTDNPEAGLMETDWLENRARIPQSKMRDVIGKVFDKAYSSGEKDMYRTRLERSKDGSSTEIYISHRGIEEVRNADGNGFRWRSSGSDPESEAAMLQLLMVWLDSGGQPAAAQSAADSPATEPALPRLLDAEGGGQTILISEPFDKSWRKVGLALEQAGIVVEDLDRSSGVYFVSAPEQASPKKSWTDRLKFWRDDEDGAAAPDAGKAGARYQVTVHESNEVCEVSALNMGGGRDAASQLIVELLYKQLTQ